MIQPMEISCRPLTALTINTCRVETRRTRTPRRTPIFCEALIVMSFLAFAQRLAAAEDGIEAPQNGYSTDLSYGRGWECNRAYRIVEETCVAVKVPPNAFLSNRKGDEWDCNRGYRKDDKTCVAINVPAQGYLTDSDYGSGWKCNRGYQVVDEDCVAVKIPENAHLDYSGNDWKCNPPNRRKRDQCVRR